MEEKAIDDEDFEEIITPTWESWSPRKPPSPDFKAIVPRGAPPRSSPNPLEKAVSVAWGEAEVEVSTSSLAPSRWNLLLEASRLLGRLCMFGGLWSFLFGAAVYGVLLTGPEKGVPLPQGYESWVQCKDGEAVTPLNEYTGLSSLYLKISMFRYFLIGTIMTALCLLRSEKPANMTTLVCAAGEVFMALCSTIVRVHLPQTSVLANRLDSFVFLSQFVFGAVCISTVGQRTLLEPSNKASWQKRVAACCMLGGVFLVNIVAMNWLLDPTRSSSMRRRPILFVVLIICVSRCIEFALRLVACWSGIGAAITYCISFCYEASMLMWARKVMVQLPERDMLLSTGATCFLEVLFSTVAMAFTYWRTERHRRHGRHAEAQDCIKLHQVGVVCGLAAEHVSLHASMSYAFADPRIFDIRVHAHGADLAASWVAQLLGELIADSIVLLASVVC
eukprot:TRINITY_DN112547_c0_g1_i1.p1 TRINITY_DN112547_c0_g1~~TRINITY_DN112547_c0_g1_i1.p1  ORF type:complete len:447 (+),score=46.71 TRINITY_DN112547_c0_g1_i1:104-1444(+)